MIYFTSDTHFNHKNILKYSNRPFASVEEMDEVLIMNWNAAVGNDDTIYHLGDFCMGEHTKYLKQLNGNIIFIKGSHDKWMKKEPLMMEIRLPEKYQDPEFPNYPRYLTLCHYSLRSWRASHFSSFHLFGHHHGRLEPHGLSFDAGVDCHGYAPISLDDVAKVMNTLKPIVDYRKK